MLEEYYAIYSYILSDMETSKTVSIIVVLIVLVGGWYWWSNTQDSAVPVTSEQSATESPAAVAVLTVSLDSKLAQYITDKNGMTLYIYSKDTARVSNCSVACAANWPPYIVTAGTTFPHAAGINGAIGTMTRPDGSIQLTYKGMPLYLWIKDTKVGDKTGDKVGGFLIARP